jgi:hypothetical protein
MKITLILIAALTIGFFLVFPTQEVYAVEYKITNQMTVQWAVTEPNNPGEQIEYAIYISPSDDHAAATKLWQGPELEYVVTMTPTQDGLFHVGLETIRMVDVGGTMEAVSTAEIGWSDDPLVAPVPFGIKFYNPPAKGSGFGPK